MDKASPTFPDWARKMTDLLLGVLTTGLALRNVYQVKSSSGDNQTVSNGRHLKV
jgi:hypothetical protein